MAIMVATNTPCPRRSAPIPRKSESPGTPENQRRGAVRTQPMVVGQRSPMRSRSQPMKGARHMEGIWRPRNMDLGGLYVSVIFLFLFLLSFLLFSFFFFSLLPGERPRKKLSNGWLSERTHPMGAGPQPKASRKCRGSVASKPERIIAKATTFNIAAHAVPLLNTIR